MREVDKRYYKINKNGTERIYTNVYRSGENYSAYEADKNGKAGKFLYLLTQSEIDKAVISENFDFSEKDFNYIYKAYMVNAKEYDNGNKETSGVWITFPADKTEISAAMESIGLSHTSHSGEYFFDDFVCNIDSIKNLLFADLTVLQLQETAIKLNTLTNFEILKLNAIMETNAKFNSLAEVAEFAGNYDYYDLIPNVRNETELGLNLICSSNIFEGIPDRFKDAIEPKSYGKYIAEVEKGIFTSKGYISRSDDEWEPLNLPDFKPKPLKTNGIDDKMIDTFIHEREVEKMDDKLKVLVVEPMCEPYVKEIDSGLESLQKEVGGLIQVTYPYEDLVGIVCNDEGKLNGMQLNRAIYNDNRNMTDIIAGTFLVVGLSDDSFTSLTDEQIKKFSDKFKMPEQFYKLGNEIVALPVKPSIKQQINQAKKEQDERNGTKPPSHKLPEI